MSQTANSRFQRVMIANRGEIAERIQRACHELGLETVTICSEADRNLPYGVLAAEMICIGPSAPSKSYLNKDALLLAAQASHAGAIHPGYGFLSENSSFAAQVEEAGIVFIGPSAKAMSMMGDKITAKKIMNKAGVPCVPGPDSALNEDSDTILSIASSIGYPVIVKATGGGGGRGMRVVYKADDLVDAVNITRSEAQQAFGIGDVYLEKFLQHPRHIEIQILCDEYGNGVWLGTRDCSLQRRHQKVVEEAPSIGIDQKLIETVALSCLQACHDIAYHGVGTFEFLYENGAFFFIEMNTRLQVEHPVTEVTTGVDIVQQQLHVAQGLQLQLVQEEIITKGHSFECRINAEDPKGGSAKIGPVTKLVWPKGENVRVDSHICESYQIPPYYDSLIAKIIVHGEDRNEAIGLMQKALEETLIEGVTTNLAMHRDLFADPIFIRGGMDIHFLENWLKEWRNQ